MATHTLLGFDYGQKRIGVAVGQTVTATARPLTTITCTAKGAPWHRLDPLIALWQPDALVVGLPLLADGSHGNVARAAERFARRLGERYDLVVHRIDERLSSWEAGQRALGRESLDAHAASVILGAYLERRP